MQAARHNDDDDDDDVVMFCLFVCLFGFLWYIKLCRLFNAKSIFIQKTVLFQTIQFSISRQFDCQKHFYFKLFSLVKQFLFKQFS